MMNVISFVIGVFLIIYLLFVILKPEKF